MVFKSLLALTLLVAAGDTVKLAKTFAPSESTTYEVSAVDKEKDVEMGGKVTFKATSSTDSKKTAVSVTSPSITLKQGGEVRADQTLDSKLTIDSHNMPTEITVKEADVAILLVSIAGYLPDADVEVGKTFDIKWEAGGNTLQGTGTLEKVEEKDGKKVASIKLRADFTPSGEPHKGEVNFLSEVDTAQGSLISSKGTVKVEGDANMEVTIKRG